MADDRKRRTTPRRLERPWADTQLGGFFAAIEQALNRVREIRAKIADHESRKDKAA
jgi:hypothetical protein